MSNPNTVGFDPGGYVDRFDSRDYLLGEVGGASIPFDWTKGYDVMDSLRTALNNPNFTLPVKDQSDSYSCGGQAWAYLAEVLEALNTNSFEERSAKFIYAQTYVPGGGSRGRDNAEIYVKQGVARESILPSYDNGHPPHEPFMERGQDITTEVRLDAHIDLSSAYAQTGVEIDEIASAISNNSGVILGIGGQNNGTWASAFPKPPTSVDWRHWVYACRAKLINGVKYIGFINSWGTTVGDSGWQWLSEDYVKTVTNGEFAVFSGWTHVFNTNPPPLQLRHNFAVNLAFGQINNEIKLAQTALQLEKIFPTSIAPTGYYGDITRQAVLAFRVKYSISSTSDPLGRSIGPLTRAKLNQLYNW